MKKLLVILLLVCLTTVSLGVGNRHRGIYNLGPTKLGDVFTETRFQDRVIIDVTDPEAFLVRKNGDTGDVFTVDTTNSIISVNGELKLLDNPITGIGHVDFDLDAAPATEPEARAWWNNTDHVLNISSGMGPVLQAGLENWVLVRNETGSQIDDGKVVFINGASSGRPLIELAKADKPTTIDRTIGVATMDIPNSTEGIVTTFGTVRGIDTSVCSPGDQLYVSATTAGSFTPTQPAYPNYIMKIGNCQTSDASTGKIAVNVIGRVEDIIENGWNGGFLESINFAVTSAVGVITGTLENDDNTKDLTMNFSDGFTVLDTTSSPVTVTLTAGADDNPTTRFVYVPIGTKTLTEGSDWPAEEHIKVATTALRTAATTATDGALRNQNWNDHIADSSISVGHIQHIGERVRQDDAKWSSGAEGSLTIVSGSTPDDVFVAVTAGKVYQLHKQDFPVLDMSTGDDIHVTNDSVAPFKTIMNLNSELTDAAGGSLSNRHYSLVVWGIMNRSGETSHLMVNLPAGSYNTTVGAQTDPSNFSVYDIPAQFRGVGFLIARFTVKHSPSNSGEWILNATQDLRGFLPNSTAGGGAGGGGVSTFLGLTDTPSAYTSQAGKLVSVNSGETALEFTDAIDGITIGGTTPAAGTFAEVTIFAAATANLNFETSGGNKTLSYNGASNIFNFDTSNITGVADFTSSGTVQGGTITSTGTVNGVDGDFSNDVDIDGVIAIGSGATLTDARIVNIDESFTTTAGAAGIRNDISWEHTTGVEGNARNELSLFRWNATSGDPATAAGSYQANANFNTTASTDITTFTGFRFLAPFDSDFTGTISNFFVFDIGPITPAAGQMTDYVGFRQQAVTIDSAGDAIGLDIANMTNSGAGDAYAIRTGTGGIEFGDTIDFTGTMGNGTDDPTTDAPTDWVEIEIGGTTYYIPAYN